MVNTIVATIGAIIIKHAMKLFTRLVESPERQHRRAAPLCRLRSKGQGSSWNPHPTLVANDTEHNVRVMLYPIVCSLRLPLACSSSCYCYCFWVSGAGRPSGECLQVDTGNLESGVWGGYGEETGAPQQVPYPHLLLVLACTKQQTKSGR
jgi:hypothetical protein